MKVSTEAIRNRRFWINEIAKISGNFGADSKRLEAELEKEIASAGIERLRDHLRLCGNIPECYSHDSTEEKLYSKYTDILLSLAFDSIGLKSIVLQERGDAADVEVIAPGYAFVADAKAFRLSRTAKNAKDFKVQAMDGWKRGKAHAMVVCPIYQLPNTSSQIYEQATTRNVCIFTYTHLTILLLYAAEQGKKKAQELLKKVFEVVNNLNPHKDAAAYWLSMNREILSYDRNIERLWHAEKQISHDAIQVAKDEDLSFLAKERERILKMTHKKAIAELLRINKIDSKIEMIKSVADNGIFTLR